MVLLIIPAQILQILATLVPPLLLQASTKATLPAAPDNPRKVTPVTTHFVPARPPMPMKNET
jgi:hypothetical protein